MESPTTIVRASYYDKDVDFDDLAKRDKDWARICDRAKQVRWIDFQDPHVVRQLTQSLIRTDFGVRFLELPDDRLCPPIPVRWNYVRWIQELLDTTTDDHSDTFDPEREVLGLDIGVGASAIYPLLACSSRRKWRMIGTDIDQHSLTYARHNVENNNLLGQIMIIESTSEKQLIALDTPGVDRLDFVMTNPPFYSSEADMALSYGEKMAAPSAICTGSENEMICPGGDVGFVTRLIDESLILQSHVQWYTAMLGKLASLQQVITTLKSHGITNFAVTCLQAGRRTNRWAVAWSFKDLRPANDVARHGNLIQAVLPPPTAQTIKVPLMSAEWAGNKVHTNLRDLDVQWTWDSTLYVGVMRASENVWSRAARRRKQLGGGLQAKGPSYHEGVPDKSSHGSDKMSVQLAVQISCRHEHVELRWLQGQEYVVFESFCGMLRRSLSASSYAPTD